MVITNDTRSRTVVDCNVNRALCSDPITLVKPLISVSRAREAITLCPNGFR